MSTEFKELFAALAAQFPPQSVRQRVQGGRTLSYITARTAMNRLDEVLGPENWEDDYVPFGGAGGVKCILTIVLPDGRKVTKTGIGGTTEMHDSSDTDKTGESDAIKRACVKFGVGRYLYQDGSPNFANGQPSAQPAALPGPPPSRPASEPVSVAWTVENPDPLHRCGNLPRTGAALYLWAKKLGDERSMGIVRYVNSWGALNGFTDPTDAKKTMAFKDWPSEAVRIVAAEVCRKLYEKDGVAVPAEALSFQIPETPAGDDPPPFDSAPLLSPETVTAAVRATSELWMKRGELRDAVKRLAEHYYGARINRDHVEDVKNVLRAASPKSIAFDAVDAIQDLSTILDLLEVAAGVEDVLRSAPDERFGVPVPEGLTMCVVPAMAGLPGLN